MRLAGAGKEDAFRFTYRARRPFQQGARYKRRNTLKTPYGLSRRFRANNIQKESCATQIAKTRRSMKKTDSESLHGFEGTSLALLEAMPGPVFVLTGKGFVLASNAAADKLFSLLDKGGIAGKNIFDFLSGDILEQGRRHMAEAAKSGRPAIFEHERKNRIYRHCVSPMPAIKGQDVFAVFTEDLTEARRTDEALRREQQRQRFLMEALPGFVFLVDAAYSIPYANRYFRKYFGPPAGRPCFKCLQGRDEPCGFCPTFEAFKQEKPAQWEWTNEDGRAFQIHSNPMTDVDGALVMLVLGIDVTARKVAEEELRQARDELEVRVEERTRELFKTELRYHDLIQSLPVVIFSMRQDFSLEFVNAACRDMLGCAPEEAMADPGWFLDNVMAEDREAVRQAFSRRMEPGGPAVSMEFAFRHARGYGLRIQARTMESSEARMSGNGRLIEGILLDVTERNFLDKVLLQREKLDTLGAISEELAHEIRNPLVPLGGFARRLAKKYPESMEAEIILTETSRLEALLDRIREYLKPASISREVCLVNAILTFCLDRLAAGSSDKDPAWSLDLDGALTPIYSDSDVLTQVFLSLINNARDRMLPEGTLSIKTYETAGAVGVDFMLRPKVADIQDPEHLLLPFEQDERNFRLAVSFRRVKDIGGHLALRQTEEATTFTVSLPKNGAARRA